MNVVANAIYYNPVLALQQLQQQGRLQHFFATWFQVHHQVVLVHLPSLKGRSDANSSEYVVTAV